MRSAEANFVCWDPRDHSEEDAEPAWKQVYDGQTAPHLREGDFERAAELFAERKHSDWDYPEHFELFVKNESTGEIRFVTVTAESGAPDLSADFDEEKNAARLLIYRLTALGRAAMEHRPRPWNWQQLRWERLHPEEAAAQKAAREKARFDRVDGRCPWPTGKAPATWDEVQWPDWIPDQVRAGILAWKTRQPSEYERTFESNEAQPRLGEVVTIYSNREYRTGRYVGCFNSMGWVVTETGDVHQGGHVRRSAADIAMLIDERRVEKLREAVTKAVKQASPAVLENALRLLTEEEAAHA